jgi:hypothetical protein
MLSKFIFSASFHYEDYIDCFRFWFILVIEKEKEPEPDPNLLYGKKKENKDDDDYFKGVGRTLK